MKSPLTPKQQHRWEVGQSHIESQDGEPGYWPIYAKTGKRKEDREYILGVIAWAYKSDPEYQDRLTRAKEAAILIVAHHNAKLEGA